MSLWNLSSDWFLLLSMGSDWILLLFFVRDSQWLLSFRSIANSLYYDGYTLFTVHVLQKGEIEGDWERCMYTFSLFFIIMLYRTLQCAAFLSLFVVTCALWCGEMSRAFAPWVSLSLSCIFYRVHVVRTLAVSPYLSHLSYTIVSLLYRCCHRMCVVFTIYRLGDITNTSIRPYPSLTPSPAHTPKRQAQWHSYSQPQAKRSYQRYVCIYAHVLFLHSSDHIPFLYIYIYIYSVCVSVQYLCVCVVCVQYVCVCVHVCVCVYTCVYVCMCGHVYFLIRLCLSFIPAPCPCSPLHQAAISQPIPAFVASVYSYPH